MIIKSNVGHYLLARLFPFVKLINLLSVLFRKRKEPQFASLFLMPEPAQSCNVWIQKRYMCGEFRNEYMICTFGDDNPESYRSILSFIANEHPLFQEMGVIGGHLKDGEGLPITMSIQKRTV